MSTSVSSNNYALLKTIANVVFFQLLWLATVGGAGQGYWWLGLPVFALFLSYHLWVTPWRKADLQLLAICVLLGGLVDTLFVVGGLLSFKSSVPSAQFAPIWICLLWAGFALTLNHSMQFFQSRPLAATIFGLIGGPLAYFVAMNVWKAVVFIQPAVIVYAALGLAWAIMTPLLLKIGFNLRHQN